MLSSSFLLPDPFMTLLRGEIYDNASIYGFCVALDYGLGTRNVMLRPSMRPLFLSFTHAALKSGRSSWQRSSGLQFATSSFRFAWKWISVWRPIEFIRAWQQTFSWMPCAICVLHWDLRGRIRNSIMIGQHRRISEHSGHILIQNQIFVWQPFGICPTYWYRVITMYESLAFRRVCANSRKGAVKR